MSHTPIKSAEDFFAKYNLESASASIDHDLQIEGVQSNVETATIIEDFNSLPSPNRYAVFVRLERGGDKELLKKITGFKWTMDDVKQHGLMPIQDQLKNMRAELKTGELWEKRLAIVQNLFALGELAIFCSSTKACAEKLFHSDALSQETSTKYFIEDELADIYRHSGKLLWDTDGDFDPLQPDEWEYAFDHKDILPLDKDCKIDSDILFNFPVGESAEIVGGDVKRTSENEFEISMTLYVKADETGNEKAIKEKCLNEGYLQDLKKRIEDQFNRTVEKGKYKFRFNVTFQMAGPEDYSAVQFTDRNIQRGHAYLWDARILNSPPLLLHETFHHLGFPDYYSEAVVDGGIREFTFKPGYSVIEPNHLMRCAQNPVIRQKELIKLIAKASSFRFRPLTPTDALRQLNWITQPEPADRELYKLSEEELMKLCRANPSDSEVVAYLIIDIMHEKKHDEAIQILEKTLSLIPKNDVRRLTLSYSLLECYALAERYADIYKAIDSLEGGGIYKKGPSQMIAEIHLEAGRFEEAREIFWRYHDKESQYDNERFHSLLMETEHKYEAIMWFKEYIFPKLNVAEQNGRTALANEIRNLESNNLRYLTIPYYEALLPADKTNIDYNLGYALALLTANRINEGTAALLKTADAYSFLDGSGLIRNSDEWDKLVERIWNEIIELDLDKRLLEGLQKIKLNGTYTNEYYLLHHGLLGRLISRKLQAELDQLR